LARCSSRSTSNAPAAFLGGLPCAIFLWESHMSDQAEVLQGTLALMVLKVLETMGPMHGYGIARRIEQISERSLSVNYGTLYPARLTGEREGAAGADGGGGETPGGAGFSRLPGAGRRRLAGEVRDWERSPAIMARFLAPGEDAG